MSPPPADIDLDAPPPTARARRLIGPDNANIEALVHGRHGDPFSVLGRHDGELRCLLPGADGVVAVSSTGEILSRLERIHPAGFFIGAVDPDEPYLLRIEWPDTVQETEDPYAFGSSLGPMDLHLFSEGRHFELGRVFGAQCVALDDGTGNRVAGVRFRCVGTERQPCFRRGGIQYLGRPPPSDARTSWIRAVGNLHSTPRAGRIV